MDSSGLSPWWSLWWPSEELQAELQVYTFAPCGFTMNCNTLHPLAVLREEEPFPCYNASCTFCCEVNVLSYFVAVIEVGDVIGRK